MVKIQHTFDYTLYDEHCDQPQDWKYTANYCYLPGYWIIDNDDDEKDYRLLSLDAYKKLVANCNDIDMDLVNEMNTHDELIDYVYENKIIENHLDTHTKRSPNVPFGSQGLIKSPKRKRSP